jgi:hypothetical protein
VAGPFAIVVRALAEDEQELLTARLRAALVPFAVDGGDEPAGAALCAVAT